MTIKSLFWLFYLDGELYWRQPFPVFISERAGEFAREPCGQKWQQRRVTGSADHVEQIVSLRIGQIPNQCGLKAFSCPFLE